MRDKGDLCSSSSRGWKEEEELRGSVDGTTGSVQGREAAFTEAGPAVRG